jgi:uncharacterized protein (DUF1330 family)
MAAFWRPIGGATIAMLAADVIPGVDCVRAAAPLPEAIIFRSIEMAKKGYWIAHVNITDPERYKDYIAANAAPLKRYGARFLVRNGESVVSRGELAGRRHVVIEFDSYAAAQACHESPEYRAAAKIRDEASNADFIIIEGYEG